MQIRNIKNIDILGTIGILFTGLISPCCLPSLAIIGSSLGLGSLDLFDNSSEWLIQCLILLPILGLYLSYRKHQFIYPLAIAIISGIILFFSLKNNRLNHWAFLHYIAMIGFLIASVWNYKRNKMQSRCQLDNDLKIELSSILTCPKCNHKKLEQMPTDACQYFYECDQCKSVLKPLAGDCCVYCSYGSVKCPPIQQNNSCC